MALVTLNSCAPDAAAPLLADAVPVFPEAVAVAFGPEADAVAFWSGLDAVDELMLELVALELVPFALPVTWTSFPINVRTASRLPVS